MALKLNFSCNSTLNGKVLAFRETTGVYNEISNPSGWGTPNKEINTVTDAYITIQPLSGDEIFTIDYTALQSAGLPDSTKLVQVHITMADLGGTNLIPFPDGTYLLKYYVTADGVDYMTSRYIYSYTNVRSCVSRMFAKIKVSKNCIGCTEEEREYSKKALEAYTYYKALLCAALTGQLDKADILLAYVNELCSTNSDCPTCNN